VPCFLTEYIIAGLLSPAVSICSPKMDHELVRRVREAGFMVAHNPIADGNCFYRAAAFQQGTDWETLKEMVFNHLERNQCDVSAWF
jgi:hypothetical protein